MITHSETIRLSVPPVRKLVAFLILMILPNIAPAASFANSDVYDVLPADTRVLQFGLGDFDGDTRQELAVLYTTADETRLTLFREESGHWSRWWDDNGAINLDDGSVPRSLETTDINGDGKAEMLAYYITEKDTAMAARILTLDDEDPAGPTFKVLLEDATSPPGYPLLGTQGQSPSVTFMRMASKEGDGYRRVYCWDGEQFEKCEEVVWEKP